MAKSLDHVLQSDGTYKWEEVELVHSTGAVEPESEEVVITEEPVVEKANDFESMTKSSLKILVALSVLN